MVFAVWQGGALDADAKKWRLFADCMNNVGMALELAAPAFGGDEYFLAFACAGSVARSLCGCAAGATRAALTQHFAVRANAADIAAKEGSQETAVTLVGMVLGRGLRRTPGTTFPPEIVCPYNQVSGFFLGPCCFLTRFWVGAFDCDCCTHTFLTHCILRFIQTRTSHESSRAKTHPPRDRSSHSRITVTV